MRVIEKKKTMVESNKEKEKDCPGLFRIVQDLNGSDLSALLRVVYINLKRFRGRLVLKAHGLLHDSSLGLRAILTKKRVAQDCFRLYST